jgi:hypothetical protein
VSRGNSYTHLPIMFVRNHELLSNRNRAGLSLGFYLLIMMACAGSQLPSDKSLEERFLRNQADFEKIISMLNEDSDVMMITDKNVFLNERSQRRLATERLDEYRRLIKRLKLEGGIQRYSSECALLIVSTTSVISSYSGKCYAYSVKEPSPLVESLDEVIKNTPGDQRLIYRRLSGNWYLCYESW